LLTAPLNDDARRTMFAAVEKLEATLALLSELSDAEQRICYVKLEREIARRGANAPHAAQSAARAEQPRDAAPPESTATAAAAAASALAPAALAATKPTAIDPISNAPSTTEPASNETSPSAPSMIEATLSAPSTTSSIELTTPDQTSSDSTLAAPTKPGDEITIDPFAEAKKRKKRELAALEHDYLARAMDAAKGNQSLAARLVGMDRSNFKRKLEEHGLRPPGTRMTTSKKIEDAAKLTDKIVQHLARNPHGLRTYEVAEYIEQAIGNAHNLLKHLKGQNRIERHGRRYNTLWTLAGGTPEPRVETIPQAAVAVVSDAKALIDGRRLRDEMAARLRDAPKPPSKAALRRAIGRLVLSGVLESAGASTDGALYRLGPNSALYRLVPKQEASELN
jgi:hypothetical protein